MRDGWTSEEVEHQGSGRCEIGSVGGRGRNQVRSCRREKGNMRKGKSEVRVKIWMIRKKRRWKRRESREEEVGEEKGREEKMPRERGVLHEEVEGAAVREGLKGRKIDKGVEPYRKREKKTYSSRRKQKRRLRKRELQES